MNSRKPRTNDPRPLCAETGPDDGVDPRHEKRRELARTRKPDRKLDQLCKQVAQDLQLSLSALPKAGEMVGVTVQAVVPAPNAGRLRVVLAVPDPQRHTEVAAIVQRSAGRLRAEVAAAISRRRAPELVFEIIVEGGDHE